MFLFNFATILMLCTPQHAEKTNNSKYFEPLELQRYNSTFHYEKKNYNKIPTPLIKIDKISNYY